MNKLPSSWHKVQICKQCELVVKYSNWRQGRDGKYYDFWDFEEKYHSNGKCLNCGDANFIETNAAWYDTSYWWIPWTWGWGYWELKQTRDKRLVMQKGLEPIRKEHEANS